MIARLSALAALAFVGACTLNLHRWEPTFDERPAWSFLEWWVHVMVPAVFFLMCIGVMAVACNPSRKRVL